ncbi:Uncharacterized protein dnl_41110 [Desulfonema limicola]|uniref:DUF4407 domain-containing protein n=1 Tax=Desulfonema limicola TaxID=45656 RepID=A0A975GHS6_9BACT|nr:hypothetical protein [Desulfonema limicola]QTA81762.1 Uncharacterized protein dnl_41110 [Desulfonema limicola]
MKNENFGFSSGNVSRESLKNNRGPILSGLLREINISRIGWSFLELFYCLIGVGAAFVSFVIEKDVFFRITQQKDFSFWIVLILESAKVMTIVVYGFLFRTRSADIGSWNRFIIKFFQFSLITLSFTCSLALISFSLDRPNLAKVRTEDIKLIESRYQEKLSLLQKRLESETAVLMDRTDLEYDKAFQRLRNHYEPRIKELRADLKKEMDNRVGKDFKGPRYREFEKLLQITEAEYAARINALKPENMSLTASVENMINQKKQAFIKAEKELMDWRSDEIMKIRTGHYGDDERANNQLINAVLRTVNDGILVFFNFSVGQITFTCLFSFLIAILIELTIYVSFYSAVLSFSSKLDLMFSMDSSHLDSKKN